MPAAPTTVTLQWLFNSRTAFSRYFVDVEMDETTGQGRLVPSKELQAEYPEDDEFGEKWISGPP